MLPPLGLEGLHLRWEGQNPHPEGCHLSLDHLRVLHNHPLLQSPHLCHSHHDSESQLRQGRPGPETTEQ